MIANKKMIRFLEKSNENIKLNISVEELEHMLAIPLEILYGCIVITNEKTKISKKQFLESLKYYTDKSGYEYSNNDCRIVDFFKSQLTIEQQYKLARIFIQCLNNRLISLTENEIVYIIGIDNNILTLHFYQKRENEVIIDENDVENFEEAIGIISSEELSLNVLQNISDE